jgi:4a-hydroxytetrahydrobiopterin dehydratase
MGHVARLTDDALAQALRELHVWELAGGKLRRVYRFHDFVEAWGFMSAAALLVQQLDHHPEWSNVYDTVTIELTTHDAGGISARDVELAGRLEALAARWPRG